MPRRIDVPAKKEATDMTVSYYLELHHDGKMAAIGYFSPYTVLIESGRHPEYLISVAITDEFSAHQALAKIRNFLRENHYNVYGSNSD